MESFVSGKIAKPQSNTEEVKNQLQALGYSVNETSEHLEITKQDLLENVIAEISPICQEAGISTEKEMILEETYPDLAMSNVYDHGRIISKYPGY